MKKMFLSTFVATALLALPTNSLLAADNSVAGTWVDHPTTSVAAVAPGENQPVQAWEVDRNGQKHQVKPIGLSKRKTNGGIQPMFTDSDGFQYYYDHYESNYHQQDNRHFWIGAVNYYNYGSTTQQMTYSQQKTTTVNWTTTGRVSVEAGLQIDLLADAKASFGFDVSASHTFAQSTTITGTANVSPSSEGTLTCYDAGEYSGGSGVWTKYSPNGSLMGLYYETTDAWTVADNVTSFSYKEAPL